MYFWQHDESWLKTPSIAKPMLERAKHLENLEAEMERKLGYDELSRLLGDAIERELSSSNAIEGISFDSRKLRSSIAEGMGLVQDEWSPERQVSGKERRAVKALVALMETDDILSHDIILKTHASFETYPEAGAYRNHPEHVLDEDDNVVYEAPPARNVQKLMDRFLEWYNMERTRIPRFLGSSLAHYFFVAIHPFRDGNGRMARMLADKSLSHGNSSRPFSMSATIQRNKDLYYDFLDKAHRNGGLDKFLHFMLDIQESSLVAADYRADKLLGLHSWMSGQSFDSAEKAILHEMTLGEKEIWTFFDATKNMWDGEAAETAWNGLIEKGIVRNGMLVFDDGTENRPK